jgi:hypothetical protein
MSNVDLNELVIKLHDVARRIEDNIGIGLLSEDVRKCADRLSELLRKDARDVN